MTSIEIKAADYQHAQRTLATLLDEWQEKQADLRIEHADLLAAIDAAKEEVGLQEARLVGAAFAVYRMTGSKQPTEGVGIRVRRTPTIIDADAAYAWAIEHRIGLKIDEPRLMGAAAGLGLTPGWMEYVERPQVTISAQLRGKVQS